MAEQEPVAQAQIDEEDDETPGYKPPALKSVDEIVNQDKEDESLQKYKQTLLGGSGNAIIDEKNPNKVIVNKLAILTEGRVMEIDLTGPCEHLKIVLKEGCKYKVQIFFYVQRDIVTGLKYSQVTTRNKIKVDKMNCMVGSYGPKAELQSYTTQQEEAPSGMIARGDYKVKSKFVDDDGHLYKEWEWTLSIKKEFE